MNDQPNNNGNMKGDHPVPSPMVIEMLPINDWDLWSVSSGGNGDYDPRGKPTIKAASSTEDETTDALIGHYEEEHGGPATVIPGHNFFRQAEDAAAKRVLEKDVARSSCGCSRRRVRM